VLQGWYLDPNGSNQVRVNLGHNYARIFAAIAKDFPPWINNQRMPIGLAAPFVHKLDRLASFPGVVVFTTSEPINSHTPAAAAAWENAFRSGVSAWLYTFSCNRADWGSMSPAFSGNMTKSAPWAAA
jgi:hypothetical protein